MLNILRSNCEGHSKVNLWKDGERIVCRSVKCKQRGLSPTPRATRDVTVVRACFNCESGVAHYEINSFTAASRQNIIISLIMKALVRFTFEHNLFSSKIQNFRVGPTYSLYIEAVSVWWIHTLLCYISKGLCHVFYEIYLLACIIPTPSIYLLCFDKFQKKPTPYPFLWVTTKLVKTAWKSIQ